MLSVWFILGLAFALAAAAAWVLLVGWRDDERRARIAGLRDPEPEPEERARDRDQRPPPTP